MESNDNFVCSMCGGKDMPCAVGSILSLSAGYGSAHDMERIEVPLCGKCCDKLFAELSQLAGAVIKEIPW